MCLAIDGQTFCEVLRAAPLIDGNSLEWVEHNLEENKHEYKETTVELLARTCGLTVDLYRDRLVRIRGQNLMHELDYVDSWVKDRFHTYFDPPRYAYDYVRGMVHTIPQISGVTPEAEERYTRLLNDTRYKHFRARIDGGFRLDELERYPEKDVWIARATRELHTDRRLTLYCQHLLERQMIPPQGIYYPVGQLTMLMRQYTRWFYEPAYRRPPGPVLYLLTAGEWQELERHMDACRELDRVKPRGKRRQGRASWRTRKQSLTDRWREWKSGLLEKYFDQLERACLDEVAPQGCLSRAA